MSDHVGGATLAPIYFPHASLQYNHAYLEGYVESLLMFECSAGSFLECGVIIAGKVPIIFRMTEVRQFFL